MLEPSSLSKNQNSDNKCGSATDLGSIIQMRG